MYYARRGAFVPQQGMVAIMPFAVYKPGDVIPPASYNTLRKWWRRGWVCAPEFLTDEERKAFSAPKPAPEPAAVSSEPATVNTVSAVSATPTGSGWWEVTFSDGTSQKMRRADVEELGLVLD